MLGNRRTGKVCVALRGKWWLPELKLTKKVTADKEGAGPRKPRIVVERAPEVEPVRFHVLSADIEAHGNTGGCPGVCSAGIAWKSDKTT